MKRARGKSIVHDLWGLWALVVTFAPVVASLALFHQRPTWWTFALAFVVVSARQHALFVVAHETFHWNLFRTRRVNELVGAWLAAYPTIMAYTAGRQQHWDHHRGFGTENDPDRYAWDWKVSERRAFLRHVLATLTGVPFVLRAASALLRRKVSDMPDATGKREGGRAASNGASKVELAKIAVCHLLILALFAVTLGWPWYFALWLLPAISLRTALDELRQFFEHRDGTLVVYRAGPLERFVFGPLNFHLHGVHHAIASEPWFRLAKAEAAARQKAPLVAKASYLGDLVWYLRGEPGNSPRVLLTTKDDAHDAGALRYGDLKLIQESEARQERNVP